MNERIRELARQAHEDVIKNTPSFLVTQEMYQQRFAELIVRDCALTAGLMEQQGRANIGAQLLDNYGVGE